MTIENETLSGNSSPSIEESILGSIEKIEAASPEPEIEDVAPQEEPSEVPAETPEEDKSDKTDEGETADSPAPNDKSRLAKAARELAAARNRGKKKVVEAKDLSVPAKGAKVAVKPTTQPKAETFLPPQEWPTSDKEQFNQLPPVAQKQSLEFYKRAVAQTTKVWQELRRKESYVGAVGDVIQRYQTKWGEAGMTAPQAIEELAATRENLITNPHQTLNNLMLKLGVTPEEIYEMRQGGRAPAAPQQRNPAPAQQTSLTRDDVIRIMEENSVRTSEQQEITSGQALVEKLRNQVTQDGRYLYPELQRDNPAIERIKPLADAIKKAQPDLPWDEITLRAIRADRHAHGTIPPGSPSPNSPRLPSAEETQRIRSASVSVRGRGNPTVPTSTPAKKGESVQQTLERNVAALFNSSH